MVEPELEGLVPYESESRKVLRGLLGSVAVVRLDVHAVHEPQRAKHVHDAVDSCRGNRDHHATAWPQEAPAGLDHPGPVRFAEVLEHRQHRDHVERAAIIEPRGKRAADDLIRSAARRSARGAVERRSIWVDPHSFADATLHGAQKMSIGAADIEQARSLGNVGCGDPDAQALQKAVEGCHAAVAAARAAGRGAVRTSGSRRCRQSNATIEMNAASGMRQLNVSSCRATPIA